MRKKRNNTYECIYYIIAKIQRKEVRIGEKLSIKSQSSKAAIDLELILSDTKLLSS